MVYSTVSDRIHPSKCIRSSVRSLARRLVGWIDKGNPTPISLSGQLKMKVRSRVAKANAEQGQLAGGIDGRCVHPHSTPHPFQRDRRPCKCDRKSPLKPPQTQSKRDRADAETLIPEDREESPLLANPASPHPRSNPPRPTPSHP
jgi:hypothetical protein